jgi:hypothetical protein
MPKTSTNNRKTNLMKNSILHIKYTEKLKPHVIKPH